MSNPNLSDVQLQNLLAEITDVMLTTDADVDALANRFQVDSSDALHLMALVGLLNETLEPVEPSERFVRRLGQDLAGMDTSNVLVRVRKLPPRVQIAAGLALVAGFMFISRRRHNSAIEQEERREAITAQ
ncbi:MAG: hypothetical protein CL610_18180 [Anaerolineaceae bacterium]|nr:hypothetical protein [Anaerolineaceae bacterium]